MDIFTLIAGIVILFLGRQVFWLFVAALGAVEGGQVALTYFADRAPWVQVVAVILGGVLGAIIGMFLQPLAAAIVGFYAGGEVAQDLVMRWGLTAPTYAWLPFVIGGIAGAILMLLIFNWALIVLSSLYGATLIVQNTHFPAETQKILFLVLFVLGLVVQTALYKRNPASL